MDISEVEYMPHQVEAIRKLHNGSILVGGVGTGKSITALGYFHDVECKAVEWTDGKARGPLEDPKPLYIITTARKRDTKEWWDECERFNFKEVPITIDSWNNIEKYVGVRDSFFIFDEQRVVGNGKWTKSFYKITDYNHWILLSATPGDSWMDYIPVFIANGFYRSRSQFLNRHAVFKPFSKYPVVTRWLEVHELERLRRKISVVMTYEKKTEQHWIDIPVEFDKERYDTIINKRWNPWEQKPIQDIAGVCYLLRRAANQCAVPITSNHHTEIVDKRALEIFWIWQKRHPKLIVFYNYDYELESLRDTLEKMRTLVNVDTGYSVAEWNGHKHEPIPDTESWIYLVQYTAGAEGWNCTKTNATAFYSQSYSYKQMQQAAGRIDRLNTPYEDLYYYVLKSKSGIDVAIEKAIKNKRKFNEKLFVEGIY